MAYNPYQAPYQNPYFNPYGFSTLSCHNSTDSIIKVNGLKSVEEYPLAPNQQQAFFHAEENIFWFKETDAVGNPRIRKFTYQEVDENSGNGEYLTRAEFNQFKELLLGGNVPVQNSEKQSDK